MKLIYARPEIGPWRVVLAVMLAFLMCPPHPRGTSAPAGPRSRPATSRPAEPDRPMTKAELDKLLRKLAREMGSTRTLRTEFRQEKHLSLFSNVIKSEGVCLFRRPATVRFELTRPFRSVMITKGKAVAKFEFIGSEWRRIKLKNTDIIRMVTGQIASWLRGKFRDQRDIYRISATTGRRTTIILTPKEKGFREYISSIELGLAAGEKRIDSVTIREPEGDYTVMKFTREQRDAPLSDKLFDTAGKAPNPLPVSKAPTTAAIGGAQSRPVTSRPLVPGG